MSRPVLPVQACSGRMEVRMSNEAFRRTNRIFEEDVIARRDFAAPGAAPVALKYAVLWKQEGDAWKWNVDCWNMDA
jgi:hypothetical protein